MPWTLYRYIAWEVIKLLVLSTLVLMTVISFAASIKPLSEGLLGPGTLLKFVGLSAPTMLAFALPFAGAFASTIVFLRMAADNEVVACSAGGISYRSILLPIVLLGALLTNTMVYLSNFVMPWFYREAARLVEQDLLTALIGQLNQNRPYTWANDDRVLYANTAVEGPVPEAILERIDSPVPPSQLVELTGVAVGQLDDAGRMRGDVTARLATALVFRDGAQSWASILLKDVRRWDPLSGQFAEASVFELPPVRVPSPFEEDVEFLSLPQLRALGRDPDRHERVRQPARELAELLAAERLRRLIVAALDPRQGPGSVTLRDVGGDERYVLSAARLERDEGAIRLLATDDQPVTIERIGRDVRRRFEARAALLTFAAEDLGTDPTVLIELTDARVSDPGSPDPPGEQREYTLQRLTWPQTLIDDASRRVDSLALLDRLEREPTLARSPTVKRAAQSLWNEITLLKQRIKAQLHSRVAAAVACLLLLLLGALMSMTLAGQMALAVYFWSFVLAVLTLILIYTGTNMAGSSSYPLGLSLVLLWSGNALLAIVIGAVYCALARN